MPSDERLPPAGGAVFSTRDSVLLAAVTMTLVAILRALASRVVTLDDAYITFRFAREAA